MLRQSWMRIVEKKVEHVRLVCRRSRTNPVQSLSSVALTATNFAIWPISDSDRDFERSLLEMKLLYKWSTLFACLLGCAHVHSQGLRMTEANSNKYANEERNLAASVPNMISQFQIAKAQFHEKLKHDYGEDVFHRIFFDHIQENGETISAGRTYFVPGSGPKGISWWRMQRKLMMKILNYMIQGIEQPFVWASGGHSAAAGHGNLFNESYTAYFERGAKDAFKAAGLNLEARNFAMGA